MSAVLDFLKENLFLEKVEQNTFESAKQAIKYDVDFSDIKGKPQRKGHWRLPFAADITSL